jgi:zinc transporter ZupT
MQGLNKIVELAMGDVNHHHGKQRRDNQRSTRLTRSATEESLDDSPSLRLTPCMCDVDVVDQLKFMNERDRERQEIIELEKKARELGIDTWDDVAVEKPTEEKKGATSNPSDPEQPLVDELLVDELLVDELLVDEPRVDQPPVDELLVDEPLVDEPPVEQPPVEQPPVDQSPVEQTCTIRTHHHTAGRSKSKKRMQSNKRLQPKKRSQSKDRFKSSKNLAARDRQEKKQLEQMGLKTAVAIMLHNFPEGLATFVATLADPKVGFVLAVAIALHNIPEGLCVALPIYYATQSRCKAFSWALLSGLSEPLAALLGWLILGNIYNHAVFAVLFGIVSGMMVIISIRELLPTALRYDPDNDFVTLAFIAGMIVMSLSLVLANL